MSKKLNLINQKFSRLLVVNEESSGRWKCLCDCGNNCVSTTRKLRSGHTRSCGCLQKEVGRSNIISYIKERGVKPYKDYVLSLIYSHYRRSASIRNLEFSLLKSDVSDLVFSSCYYCGTVGSNKYDQHQRKSTGYEVVYYNGIDRVNNNVGYILNNCVSCCKYCNRAKREYSIDEFTSWLDQVARYRYNVNH